MSKLSFRARALDASKPMPIYLAEELPDLPDYSAINRAVPQMPSGMEKEEESEHHLQRAISGTGLIIPTPEVCEVTDLAFYERCYPPDYKMPKQHIHMQPLWEEQETPEYDIDSEDERWLKQQHYPELTELLFEQMIDKLERCSGQNAVTLEEAKLLLQRCDDIVIAVYDYWLNKRLSTLHPLILSVKTESRPGQSTNNPYLAFRRRTEKMQTRKNRKNDETSYEKMVKLRRELARALSLLRLVARREQAKRELVKLTAVVAERRHAARDYSPAPPEPVRSVFGGVGVGVGVGVGAGGGVGLGVVRRDPAPPPYAPPPAHLPSHSDTRQREKRPYKRRKHRHHTSGVTPLRGDSGIYTSSEEETAGRAEAASPPDDGPFAFRRKAGCFYEMPTSTLCGDPVSEGPEGLFQHELDPRHRYTLISLSEPYTRCIGFGRRRVTRGGRIAIDRVSTRLDDLWPDLPAALTPKLRREEVEFETKAHRSPKEMVRDYLTSGKYPWRHAFRKHLARNPHLWVSDVKTDVDDLSDLKVDVGDLKVDVGDLKVDVDDLKMDVDVLKLDKADISDLPQDSDISFRTHTHTHDNVDRDNSDNDRQVLDSAVRVNLDATLRERSYSPCSDSSYDSDRSLYPVEKEFEKFISEVNRKWPHYRPNSPPWRPPSPPPPPLSPHQPLAVSLQLQPAQDLHFTTDTFTLHSLMPALEPLWDPEVTSINSDDHLSGSFGSSSVRVTQDKEELYSWASPPLPAPITPAPAPSREPSTPARRAVPVPVPVTVREPHTTPPLTASADPAPSPSPSPLQQQQVKIERRKTPEPTQTPAPTHTAVVTIAHSASLPPKPGHSPSPSPARRHASAGQGQLRRADVTLVTAQDAPTQIVTVAVSESLKVRLQNHLAGGSSTAIINGPYANAREHAVVTSVGMQGSVGRRSASLVQLAPVAAPTPRSSAPSPRSAAPSPRNTAPSPRNAAPTRTAVQQPPQPLLISQPHTIHHVPTNKLKVLHAHPLSQSQRSMLGGARGLPAVVSIPLETKSNAAIIKGAPLTQLFEIKGGQLSKGPHLVNVVRPPQPAKGMGLGVTRLEVGEPNARQIVSVETSRVSAQHAASPRVSVSVDARQLVRAPHHHIHLKNRTFQLQASPRGHAHAHAPSPPLAVVSGAKGGSIPSAVVANLLHQKHMQLPKGGQKIAISSGAGQALAANVQAIALNAAQLKARQARLIGRPQATREIVESTPSTSKASESGGDEEGTTNGVRRRGPDTAMEVT